MPNPSKLVHSILDEINSDSIKDSISMMDNLVDVLENKSDPDFDEVNVVNEIHSFIEKLKLLESRLRSLAKTSNNTPARSKLDQLYEKLSYNSGSIYRD